jgi:hypothetical protein
MMTRGSPYLALFSKIIQRSEQLEMRTLGKAFRPFGPTNTTESCPQTVLSYAVLSYAVLCYPAL